MEVLGIKHATDIRRMIIFNVRQTRNGYELAPELAYSFIRHTYSAFYHDFTNVEQQDTPFVWQHTLHAACQSFQQALLRYAYGIRLLHIRRKHSRLPNTTTEEARDKYDKVIAIALDGTHALQPAFAAAVASAEAASNARRAQQTQWSGQAGRSHNLPAR